MNLFDKLNRLLAELESRIFTDTGITVPLQFAEGGADDRAHMIAGPHTDWTSVDADTIWGAPGRYFWFAGTLHRPSDLASTPLALRIEAAFGRVMGRVDPQCLVRLNGRIHQGGDANHREILLPERARLDVMIEAGTIEDRRQLSFALRLLTHDRAAEALYFDLKSPLIVAQHLAENDPRRHRILALVREALNQVDFRDGPPERFAQSLAAAAAVAKCIYDMADTDAAPEITFTGHTHIDVAWLWREQETRQKMARSMSTALTLMEQYPDYRFMYNQGYLLDALAQDYPDLHAGILAAHKRGQFEIEGALWLEPDANMTGGEAFVRHITKGIRYHQETFGVRPRIVWLPDTFGYTAALPQIMARAGLEVFVTHKLSWSDTNRMPNEIFWWQGIDGSQVPTYFLTTQGADSKSIGTTYCPNLTPSHVMGAWNRYGQKTGGDQSLFLVYGHGDGGGGPTRPMLEHIRRMERGIPGCPRVVHGTMGRYFTDQVARMNAAPARYPSWVGELYLERHRGSFTSVAKVKRDNRRAEAALREIEALASLVMVRAGLDWPEDEITALWDILLLNQFHDILPGSSIREVYEDSDRDFEQFFAGIKALRDRLAAALGGAVVLNAFGHETAGLIEVAEGQALNGIPSQNIHRPDGSTANAALLDGIPALSAVPVELQSTDTAMGGGGLSVTPTHLESEAVHAEFDGKGRLTSFIDKRSGREALSAPANALTAFRDLPEQFDAWDIDIEDQDQAWPIDDLQSAKVVETGPHRAAIRFEWAYERSRIVQIVSLTADGPLEFDTIVDWAEKNTLVKTSFPLDIHTDTTQAEIQFGHVTRPTHKNTSWDQARFEVPMHRWVAMSEPGFGIALLNDCKYGYDTRHGALRLTLLRAPTWPWDGADIGQHRFRYAILPFDDLAQVLPQAERFNAPPRLLHSDTPQVADLSPLAETGTASIAAEALKRADTGTDLILRLVEREGRRQAITLRLAPEITAASETDLTEVEEGPQLALTEASLPLTFAPFEIKTLRLNWTRSCMS